ncbi:MAG: tRNA (adenosine(37)-N6)-dimethylallyltransferase MiaA [Nanoarchaeota archaeon]|nr:tRNA (adenosine(37)-N6)-dimethylallyltransferase MiaA [Nanoarchaeota archaeon]
MKSDAKLKLKRNVVVILGPTASGKSELAVQLAKKFSAYGGGEVISADSRQVYRGLDIGTGKVPISFERSEKTKLSIPSPVEAGRGIPMYYKGIRHHLIDVASPKRQFSAARFQRLGQKALRDILRRGKLPIICGGTGFYVDALLSPDLLSLVPPQRELRRELERRSLDELYDELWRVDSKRAETIDRKNKRRLIRALEIVQTTRIPTSRNIWKSDFQILKIGLLVKREELKERIARRFQEWMREGFLEEVRGLRAREGLSWKKIESFGLNYRTAAEYLQGKISREEMIEKSISEIYKYSKRQMTWFRRDKDIQWVQAGSYVEAENFLRKFLDD